MDRTALIVQLYIFLISATICGLTICIIDDLYQRFRRAELIEILSVRCQEDPQSPFSKAQVELLAAECGVDKRRISKAMQVGFLAAAMQREMKSQEFFEAMYREFERMKPRDLLPSKLQSALLKVRKSLNSNEESLDELTELLQELSNKRIWFERAKLAGSFCTGAITLAGSSWVMDWLKALF